MGLFAKKQVVCERCGKVFETRVGMTVCDECLAKEQALKDDVKGYNQYRKKILYKGEYTLEEAQEIIRHRNAILEKYRITNGISRTELAAASLNYRRLSDAEASAILLRAANSSMKSTISVSYAEHIFALSMFERIIVDADDVFAAAFRGYGGGLNYENIVCILFTNDPYVPVFAAQFAGKQGLFESKSKKGRGDLAEMISSICPNLTYEPQDEKKLKKQLKQEGAVRGRIALEDMLRYFSAVYTIYNEKKADSYLAESTRDLLDEYGYISEDEINALLQMDKMLNRNYWNKQSKKLGKYLQEQG